MSRAQQVKSSRIFHQPLWRKANWTWPFTTSLNPVAAIISSSGWSQPPEGGLGILASPKEPGSKSKGRLYQRAKWTLHMHIMLHLKWSYRSSDWWEVRVCCQVLPQFWCGIGRTLLHVQCAPSHLRAWTLIDTEYAMRRRGYPNVALANLYPQKHTVHHLGPSIAVQICQGVIVPALFAVMLYGPSCQ